MWRNDGEQLEELDNSESSESQQRSLEEGAGLEDVRFTQSDTAVSDAEPTGDTVDTSDAGATSGETGAATGGDEAMVAGDEAVMSGKQSTSIADEKASKRYASS